MTDSRGPGEGWQHVVYAVDTYTCTTCGEPWCSIHQDHYADCPCIGPDEDSVQYCEHHVPGSGVGFQYGRRIRYKLMRQRRDGSLGPLFINRSRRISVGEWMDAEDHPTKGYAHRPGWHVVLQPYAPHLSMRGRVWMCVAVTGYEEFERPERQGGKWLLAQRMIVLGGLNDELHTSS